MTTPRRVTGGAFFVRSPPRPKRSTPPETSDGVRTCLVFAAVYAACFSPSSASGVGPNPSRIGLATKMEL